MSHSIIENIRNDDPSFDPLATALVDAGVSREQFAAALDRVVIDGNFGPISPADWREQDGREPATVAEALAVLGKVSDAVSDYRLTSTEYCADPDECEGEDGQMCLGHDTDEVAADADDLRREIFAQVREIYGSLPF